MRSASCSGRAVNPTCRPERVSREGSSSFGAPAWGPLRFAPCSAVGRLGIPACERHSVCVTSSLACGTLSARGCRARRALRWCSRSEAGPRIAARLRCHGGLASGLARRASTPSSHAKLRPRRPCETVPRGGLRRGIKTSSQTTHGWGEDADAECTQGGRLSAPLGRGVGCRRVHASTTIDSGTGVECGR